MSAFSIRDSAINAKSGRQPSRGAFACLQLFQRYSKAYGPDGCYPGQEHIASELRRRLKRPTLGLRTVERWISELRDLQAIHTTRRGPRSSTYRVLWTNCDSWLSFLGLATKNGGSSAKPTDQQLTAENGGSFGGSTGGSFGPASITESPSGCLTPSGVELGFEHHTPEQHHSPVVNDVVSEKPSPEAENQNQEAAIAEVWAVVKARTVVAPTLALTKANRAAIRAMLDQDQSTVDFAKQLVFRGSLRKLAARVNHGEESPIVSLRYFLALIDDVKRDGADLCDISRRAYWRHIEQRLIREERKWMGAQGSAARSYPASVSLPHEERGVA